MAVYQLLNLVEGKQASERDIKWQGDMKRYQVEELYNLLLPFLH
jgi:hypothetical protein